MRMTRRTGSRVPVLLILLAALCLPLTGCGGGEKTDPFETADVQTILDAGVFSEELEPVESDLVCGLYGLDSGKVQECTAYLSTGATAEELVLFVMADKPGADSAKAACEKRVKDQITAYESYMPAEVSKLESAVIEQRGSTVLLVVASDAAGAAAAVDGLS